MRKLNSVWFMGFSVVLGLLATLMMVVPLFKAGGTVYNCNNAFFDSGSGLLGYKGAWPSFIGFMLIVVTTIAVFIISLPVVNISFKTEKIVLIGGSVLEVIGLILIMLITVFWNGFNGWNYDMGNGINLYVGSYLAAGFSLLAVCCNVIAYRYDKE